VKSLQDDRHPARVPQVTRGKGTTCGRQWLLRTTRLDT